MREGETGDRAVESWGFRCRDATQLGQLTKYLIDSGQKYMLIVLSSPSSLLTRKLVSELR